MYQFVGEIVMFRLNRLQVRFCSRNCHLFWESPTNTNSLLTSNNITNLHGKKMILILKMMNWLVKIIKISNQKVALHSMYIKKSIVGLMWKKVYLCGTKLVWYIKSVAESSCADVVVLYSSSCSLLISGCMRVKTSNAPVIGEWRGGLL